MDSFAPVQAGQVGTEPFYLIEMFIERDVCGAELRYETSLVLVKPAMPL